MKVLVVLAALMVLVAQGMAHAEPMAKTDASAGRYRVIFKPSVVLPDIEVI